MESSRVRFVDELNSENTAVEPHEYSNQAATSSAVTTKIPEVREDDSENPQHSRNEITNIDLTSAEALAELELKIAALQTGKKSKIAAAMDNVELQETEEQVNEHVR